MAKLRAIAADANSAPRDRSFAASLVQQFDSKGRLSDKQWACAERMGGPVTVGSTPTVSTADLALGLYTVGTDIWWVRTGRNSGNTYAMRLAAMPTEGEKPEWIFVRGGLRTVAQGGVHDHDGTVAATLGHASHFCCFCSIELEVGESVDRGYGPACADKYALPFDHATYAAQVKVRRENREG